MQRLLPVFILLAALLVSGQQPIQLTDVPPKPTCTPFLNTGACADLWRSYNRALAQRQQEELQLYVNRQKELASQAATAPLQEQIDGLNKLVADQQAQISKLQKQMQADASAALDAKQAAATSSHQQGFWEGLGVGAGSMLALILLVFGIRRFTRNFTITKKAQSQGASA